MDRYGQIRPTGDHDAVKSTIDTGLRPVRCTTVVDPGYVLCYQDWPSAYDSVHLEAKGALRPSFKLAHSVHVHGSFESSTVRVGGDRIQLEVQAFGQYPDHWGPDCHQPVFAQYGSWVVERVAKAAEVPNRLRLVIAGVVSDLLGPYFRDVGTDPGQE